MEFENLEISNVKGAIRGMRNPMNSWDKANYSSDCELINKLTNAGPSHRKVLRQVFVCVDINAPLYWWKEFDQYKVGITTNSCSTMHTLHKTPITRDCFAHKELIYAHTLQPLEYLRQRYLETKDKELWVKLIVNLPESWLQKRTVTMNLENILNIKNQRKGHKLEEWKEFIDFADEVLKEFNRQIIKVYGI